MPGLLLLSGRSSSKSPTRSGELATACEGRSASAGELHNDDQTYLNEVEDFVVEVLSLGDIYDGIISKEFCDLVEQKAETI